jgi:hypothetical protein
MVDLCAMGQDQTVLENEGNGPLHRVQDYTELNEWVVTELQKWVF